MMKIFLTLIVFAISHLSIAQLTIKKSAIDSGGSLTNNASIKMLQTFGEVVVQENSNTTWHISEGFIGRDMREVLALNEYNEMTQIRVYPNPATDYLILYFTQSQNYKILLTDVNGKQLEQYTINADRYHIDISNLQQAVYGLIILDSVHKTFQSFKIIKK